MIALYIFAGICGVAGLLYTIIYPIHWLPNLLATIFGLLFPAAVFGYCLVVAGENIPFSMNTWAWWGWLIISIVDIAGLVAMLAFSGDEFTLIKTTSKGIEKCAVGLMNFVRYMFVFALNGAMAMAIIVNLIG